MCKCDNVAPGSAEQINQSIRVEIPAHMHSYRMARLKEGLSANVSIDSCCFAEIWLLWKLGITTYGCCCGHNKQESFVNVSDADVDYMLEMGYVQNHPDPKRKDTFKLKSV